MCQDHLLLSCVSGAGGDSPVAGPVPGFECNGDASVTMHRFPRGSFEPRSVAIPLSALPLSRDVWRQFLYPVRLEGAYVDVAVASTVRDIRFEALSAVSHCQKDSELVFSYDVRTFSKLAPSCGHHRGEPWQVST
jgi:hypothetical protein